MKGKIKERWGELTDDDLDVISGKRDQRNAQARRKLEELREQRALAE